ncbi:NAD(P)H-hydrate dehydratase [Psychrosphaera sp. 1_MG-2023]|uniref:NAD(P)H-hydrate dehydratase n=1 Tax=Psychrosphaera sp. 1_MG-2023 TaxID=3062643 RepID=UPI0026E23662|nr:NAD(P)H-hydrate dehydratase [Psychrosphaera sp. 1_MG-2023]MDO6721185.1 NAD(P)H-hydrate dehydratase [Psychrosphaera sp. 1_MG-2023]
MIYKETIDTLPSNLYLAEQIKLGEIKCAEQQGIDMYQLMEAAGHAVFDCVLAKYSHANHIIVLAGTGNNGGDAYVVARLINHSNMPVTVFSPKPQSKLRGDAEIARQSFLSHGGTIVGLEKLPDLVDELHPSLLIDGLLGTGFDGALRDEYRVALEFISTLSLPIIAIDLPSGLNGDTGHVVDFAIKATYTVTFVGLKVGLVTGDGPDYCGTLLFSGLGIEQCLNHSNIATATWLKSPIQAQLQKRKFNSHKGSFGHVVCIGGAVGMPGAIFMAAKSALRSGAGKVTVITHPQNVTLINSLAPELMVFGSDGEMDQSIKDRISHADILVVGPGLSVAPWGESVFTQLVADDLLAHIPTILDADALNLLCKHYVPLVKNKNLNKWVLTPHPLEAARLLDISVLDVSKNRVAIARDIAHKFGAVVVLKGCGSIITDGVNVAINGSGNPGMATAGMGDVLAGVIAGVMTNFDKNETALQKSTQKAVFLHGLAGDITAKNGEIGIISTDVIELMPQALDICIK